MKTYHTEFKGKLLEFINDLSSNIVLRSDISKFGNPRKISRNLKALVNEGKLIKLWYGVYAKTEQNLYLSKNVIKGGFEQATLEALNRLGVKWELSKARRDYNEKKSAQVPATISVRLKTRYRGTLTDDKRTLKFENEINAT